MPNKLTDAEVKKALECCIKASHFGDCFENQCPLVSEKGCKVGKETLYPYALDLINRQEVRIHQQEKTIMEIQNANLIDFKGTIANYKAENESLKAEVERLNKIAEQRKKAYFSKVAECIEIRKTAKSEAYREFAEKVKIFVIPQKANGYTREIVLKRDIDNLLKELVGDADGENN